MKQETRKWCEFILLLLIFLIDSTILYCLLGASILIKDWYRNAEKETTLRDIILWWPVIYLTAERMELLAILWVCSCLFCYAVFLFARSWIKDHPHEVNLKSICLLMFAVVFFIVMQSIEVITNYVKHIKRRYQKA